MRSLIVAMGIAVAACGASEPCAVSTSFTLAADEKTGPMMRPGQNCLRCHVANGQASNKPFSVGGTVYAAADANACDGAAGVTIRVTDSTGKKVSMVSNEVGNFWSLERLTQPLNMEAELGGRIVTMPVTAPTGGCALCHSWPDAVSASGRIRAP